MEKIVFKNLYVNIVIGALLIVFSFLGYFLGWFEDYLPFIIGGVLLLLSLKRFIYTYKKIVSKNATLILVIELVLDFIFVGLLFYLGNHIAIFMGLVIYVRGVSYLLINYIATRKIKIVQYLTNIGYVTLGAFLMFASLNGDQVLVLGLSFLTLVIGLIYLQNGLVSLVKKEEIEEEEEKQTEEKIKELKKLQEQKEKVEKKQNKAEEKIEELEKKVKEVEVAHKQTVEEHKKLEKQITQERKDPVVAPTPKPVVTEKAAPVKPKVNYEAMTVVELRALAKEKNITGVSQMNKAQLVAILKGK